MNDIDINKLMQILSTMDKKDLEVGMQKANQILNSKSKDEILKEINKKF